MEEVRKFRNKEGKLLTAILHKPLIEEKRYKVGVIISNSGLKDRVGPHRLYIKIARLLSGLGCHVLRYDAFGLGDSEGELGPAGLSAEKFLLIEQGIYTSDAISALDAFLAMAFFDKIVLMGLCGGAITSLFAACKDPRVDSLIMLEPSIVLDASDSGEKLHPQEISSSIATYLRKLTNPKYWLRLFTFRTNYQELFRNVTAFCEMKFIRKNKGETDKNTSSSQILDRPINKKFFDSFTVFLNSGRKALFLIGETDRAAWEFKNKFEVKFTALERFRKQCKVVDIKTANHEFASTEAQTAVLREIEEWFTDFMRNP